MRPRTNHLQVPAAVGLGAELLTAEQVCARYRRTVTPSRLEAWRFQKTGPAYIRVGGAVFYRLHDLTIWEAANKIELLPLARRRVSEMADRRPDGPEQSEFLLPEHLSARYHGRVSLGTLERWRWEKSGPSFHKLGGAVLYRLADVAAWEERCRIRTDGTASARLRTTSAGGPA